MSIVNEVLSSIGCDHIVDVWVIDESQDNGMGATNNIGLVSPYLNPNANAKIVGLNNSSASLKEVTTFSPLTFSSGNMMGQNFGAEASLAYNYGNEEVYFVKVVEQGTSMGSSWATGTLLRNKAISYINYAKQYFIDNNIKVRWLKYKNQWEQDADNATYSTNYGTNEENYEAELLAQTGVIFDKVIWTKVNTSSYYYTNFVTNATKILDYQESRELSQDNLTLLDVSDLEMWEQSGNFIHQKAYSQITIGNRLFSMK
jgi:hypothetical protein